MKSFVITILDNAQSVAVADRCIDSGKKHGLTIEKYSAYTPKSMPRTICANHGIPIEGFKEKYSRTDNCISAFLSHYTLWGLCIELNEPVIIFEHDAIVINNVPNIKGNVVNLGTPSYGKFKTPTFLGEGPLTSKPYFPGAHAYWVTPFGAKLLKNAALTDARPTDVFLNIRTFPFLQENYPWIAEARDSFTTIQNETGCQAKHNYNDNYEII